MIASGETIPYWALSLAFWLHMLATVVWIGGLVAVVVLVLPAAQKTLQLDDYATFLGNLQRRLDPLAWLSLAVLLATGLFQMSANPNYEGFLSISNRWAASMLIKHILFIGMIAISAYDLGDIACLAAHRDQTHKGHGHRFNRAAAEAGNVVAAHQPCIGGLDPWPHRAGACRVDCDLMLGFGGFEEDKGFAGIIMIEVAFWEFSTQRFI
jgi:uncharacterized membrane protein